MPIERQPGFAIIGVGDELLGGTGTIHHAIARVVAKYPDDGVEAKSMIAAELICNRLAVATGIAVPAGDVGADPDSGLVWVTAQVDLEGTILPPADVRKVAKERPSEYAAIAAFDAWVHNVDRSDENLIYSPTVGLWAIDHAEALGGAEMLIPGSLSARHGEGNRMSMYWRVRPDGQLLSEWSRRLRSTPIAAIERAVADARDRGLLNRAQGVRSRSS